jgi:hypothetical protein
MAFRRASGAPAADVTSEYCADHEFARAVDTCDECGWPACAPCLLTPLGPERPLCRPCAMAAAGIRSGSARAPRLDAAGLRRRRKERKAELRAAPRTGAPVPAEVDPAADWQSIER